MRELCILVVEDEALVQDLIAEALEEAGYRVVRAFTADEAMTALGRATRLAGLVTDVNLGRGQPSGWDIAREARARHRDIAVVYVSGDSAHEWEAGGVPLSVMVMKPFATSQIVVALADMLNARSSDA